MDNSSDSGGDRAYFAAAWRDPLRRFGNDMEERVLAESMSGEYFLDGG